MKLLKQEVINKTTAHVKKIMFGEGSGHDWWHIVRVLNNAKLILKSEPSADPFVVELAVLLHDISDWKSNGGSEKAGAKIAKMWLFKLKVDEQTVDNVCDIIATSSFKGPSQKRKMNTLEGQVMQDADRLDAIGAIGIARCFAFGGNKGMPIHDPCMPDATTEYGSRLSLTSIKHFYDKMLLVKDLMNTEPAKKLAIGRHKYMEDFLKQFYKEWDGEA